MKLPNGDRAVVPIEKLRDYSLNPEHEEGKHKARVFAEALGLGRDDADWLRNQLLRLAATHNCVLGKKTPFGQRYIIDATIAKTGRGATVRTVWNISPGESQPRLITCYVL